MMLITSIFTCCAAPDFDADTLSFDIDDDADVYVAICACMRCEWRIGAACNGEDECENGNHMSYEELPRQDADTFIIYADVTCR